MHLDLILIGVVALVVAALAVGSLSRLLRRRGVFDVPNRRSAHRTPTPRGGGVGLVAGFAAGLGVASFFFGLPTPGWAMLAGAAALVLIGARDDWTAPLSVGVRLSAQTAAAALVLAVAGPLERFPLPSPLDFELGWSGYLFGAVWIVGVTNIYNFLDGIDGHAGTQALVAATALMLFPFEASFFATGAALAGAAVGFLLFNWHPASIFMGDSGSTSIGFFIATMPFHAASPARSEAIFLAALALWFFLADGAYTLLARALRREKFWLPHNGHLYQRLVRSGLRHDQVVLSIGAGAFALLLAVRAYSGGVGGALAWPPLLLACAAFFVLRTWTLKRESRVKPAAGTVELADIEPRLPSRDTTPSR